MVKKLFALASVTALGGLVAAAGVAGCSSDNPVGPVPPVDSGIPDAKKPDASKVDKDSGDVPVDDTPACANAISIPAQFAYKSAGAKQLDACTEAQIQNAMKALALKSATGAAYDFDKDIAPALGGDAGACAPCLNGTATSWRVFNAGSPFYTNFAGCLEMKGGVDAACAKGIYDINLCLAFTCSSQSCTTTAEQNECTQWAVLNNCKEYNDETSSCKFDKLDAVLEQNGCTEGVDIADSFCGTGEGKLDGGT